MEFLLDLALVLILAKVFGEFFERIEMPELLGAIVAGFLLGPILGLVDINNIAAFGQVGLILLLFIVGFEEVNLEQMLRNKKSSVMAGLFGSILPLIAGYLLAQYFGFGFGASLFIGVALAATSITISLGSFIAKGQLNTRVGRTILGASVVDDIVGLFLLAFVVSMAATGALPSLGELGSIVFGMVAFAAIFLVAGWLFPKLVAISKRFEAEEAQFSVTIVLVILLAFLADKLGLSTVLGAFLAGVILSHTSIGTKRFSGKLDVISEGFFIPLFFAWVGLQIVVDASALSMFTLALVAVALASKMIACYGAGMLSGLNNKESLALGIGMIPRGEVAMVILVLGTGIGVLSASVFSSFLILIFVSVFLTPVLLSPLLSGKLPK
ncbi:MAG: cation:proton antiporter [Candidatus Diapherotrites archaeon]|nr:cation:proton antiporter [Candidatus Diapherotrites archaeon]